MRCSSHPGCDEHRINMVAFVTPVANTFVSLVFDTSTRVIYGTRAGRPRPRRFRLRLGAGFGCRDGGAGARAKAGPDVPSGRPGTPLRPTGPAAPQDLGGLYGFDAPAPTGAA